nr:MAG TPA: hypothetical protein [Caudoviricetes sp.]
MSNLTSSTAWESRSNHSSCSSFLFMYHTI